MVNDACMLSRPHLCDLRTTSSNGHVRVCEGGVGLNTRWLILTRRLILKISRRDGAGLEELLLISLLFSVCYISFELEPVPQCT